MNFVKSILGVTVEPVSNASASEHARRTQALPRSDDADNTSSVDVAFLLSRPLVYRFTTQGGSIRERAEARLKLEEEWESIVAAYRDGAKGKRVRIRLYVATLANLKKAVLVDKCAVLHVAGHGRHDSLAFEAESTNSGYTHMLSNASIRDTVSKAPRLACVLITACSSTLVGHVFQGAGIPHVVCTSGQILDSSCLTFAKQFHTSLIGGASVKSAYDEAMHSVDHAYDKKPGQAMLFQHMQSQFHTSLIGGTSVKSAYDEAMYSVDHAYDKKPGQAMLFQHLQIDFLLPEEANTPIFEDLPEGKFEDSSRSVRRHNLPRALPEFIGRNKEIQWIYAKCVSKESHKETPHMLYGHEKAGKTVLLKEVARYLLPRSHESLEGVFYIDLANNDPQLRVSAHVDNLGQVVAGHMNIWKKPVKSDDEFCRRIGRSTFALFFDHADAVSRTDYVVEFVEKLLEQCPNVRAFVAVRTSRLSAFSTWRTASSREVSTAFTDDSQTASYLLKAVGFEKFCGELLRHGEIQLGAKLNADVHTGISNSTFVKAFNRSIPSARLAVDLLQRGYSLRDTYLWTCAPGDLRSPQALQATLEDKDCVPFDALVQSILYHINRRVHPSHHRSLLPEETETLRSMFEEVNDAKSPGLSPRTGQNSSSTDDISTAALSNRPYWAWFKGIVELVYHFPWLWQFGIATFLTNDHCGNELARQPKGSFMIRFCDGLVRCSPARGAPRDIAIVFSTRDHDSYPQCVRVSLKDDMKVCVDVEGEAVEFPNLLDFVRDVFVVGTHVVSATDGSRVDKSTLLNNALDRRAYNHAYGS